MAVSRWNSFASDDLPEDVRRRLDAEERRMIDGLPINRLRAFRNMTQEELASLLGMAQSNVSRLDRQADMHVSTLAHIVEAMGGELEIRANVPNGKVVRLSRLSPE